MCIVQCLRAPNPYSTSASAHIASPVAENSCAQIVGKTKQVTLSQKTNIQFFLKKTNNLSFNL